MSPWLLTLALSAASFAPYPPLQAFAASYSGPASAEEAAVLWKEARRELESKEYSDAVPKLRRLIDRYPSHEGFTEAHFLLGAALLSLGRAREAESPLRYYIQALGTTNDADRARILLGQAKLENKEYLEAEQLARELDTRDERKPLAHEIKISGQILQALALHGLGHETQADLALESAKKGLLPADASLAAEVSSAELRLKLAQCARLPGPKAPRMDEAQMQSVLERRGDCLGDSLVTYRKVLRAGNLDLARRDTQRVEEANRAYRNSCANPPAPSGQRTQQEKRKYIAELKLLLAKTCKSKFERNFGLFETPKDDIPEAMLPLRNRVLDSLRNP